jgi:stage V sporulation protein R
MESFINPPEYIAARQREMDEAKGPALAGGEVKDVLGFLIEHAPLPNWKRDILAMLREEAYYFAPQAQTKIMNEGWASYWHEKIMTRCVLNASELIDFADHHSSTLAVHPGQLNPYKLGYELFHDIERRWDTGRFGKEYEECDDIATRASWDRRTGQGLEKIFQVRAIYNDMTVRGRVPHRGILPRAEALHVLAERAQQPLRSRRPRLCRGEREAFVLAHKHGPPPHRGGRCQLRQPRRAPAQAQL